MLLRLAWACWRRRRRAGRVMAAGDALARAVLRASSSSAAASACWRMRGGGGFPVRGTLVGGLCCGQAGGELLGVVGGRPGSVGVTGLEGETFGCAGLAKR